MEAVGQSVTGSGLDRRAFLAGLLTALLGSGRWARAESALRHEAYTARTTLLYGLLRFETIGAIEETVDHVDGRYRVAIAGEGAETTTRVESEGVLRDGRFAPVRTLGRFVVYGRESYTETRYDYGRRTIEYHARAETFLLRRHRVVDDRLALGGAHVDDVISAILNYAERRWLPDPDGVLRTLIVRRRRRLDEGPDDVERAYQAEIVPFVLRVQPDPQTGGSSALFDMTRFSSWARENEPARITFGPDRRPETITASLMLGTSVAIRFGTPAAPPTSRAIEGARPRS